MTGAGQGYSRWEVGSPILGTIGLAHRVHRFRSCIALGELGFCINRFGGEPISGGTTAVDYDAIHCIELVDDAYICNSLGNIDGYTTSQL